MIVCSPCLHVHISSVCVLLKIDSGISGPSSLQWKLLTLSPLDLSRDCVHLEKEAGQRSVKAEGGNRVRRKNAFNAWNTFKLWSAAASGFHFTWNSWYELPLFQCISAAKYSFTVAALMDQWGNTVILMCASLSSVSLVIGWRKEKGFFFTFSIY